MRIACQFAYVAAAGFDKSKKATELEATIYGFMMLISYIGLLQYLRMIREFRTLIDLITNCFMEVINFLIVTGIMLMAFVAFFYYRDNIARPETLNFSTAFQKVTFVNFGDFGMTDPGKDDDGKDLPAIKSVDWVVFGMCIMAMAVLMMNLLIGILSEKLSELLSQSESRNYTNLLSMIEDLEQLHFT